MEPTTQTINVLLPIALDAPLTYKLKSNMELNIGDFVEVPLGRKTTTGVVWPTNSDAPIPPKLKSILGKSALPPLAPNHIQFLQRMCAYTLNPQGMSLRASIQAAFTDAQERTQLLISWNGEQPKRLTQARQRILSALEQSSALLRPDLAKEAGVSTSTINALIDEGILQTHAQRLELAGTFAQIAPMPAPNFTPSQSAAIAQIAAQTAPNTFSVHLIDGITGSGKTEVYLESIIKSLKSGEQVLVVLPEIALTSELTKRFAKRLGQEPALWHNRLTERQRARIWQGLASGEIKLLLGARSSLFLPMPKLGLIVVDEEHDSSFKQDEGIHYHGRDMAVLRAQCTPCPILLASATPSLESQVNVDKGRYKIVHLAERAQNRSLPEIKLINLKQDKPAAQNYLSQELINALAQNLENKQQSLLYLNRRGYAPLTLCKTCGHKFGCPQCSTWLVTHIFRHALICHHCGHTQKIPPDCPSCGTVDSLTHVGPGIEKLTDEVANLFPQAKVLALSSDLAGGTNRLFEELEKISSGNIDILIGTQVVAKGHNFPHLTLVGVVDADAGLGGLDPRAMERTFQVLAQVTGRAGRGQHKGVAYIQTYDEQNTVLQALKNRNEAEFYAQEKRLREQAKMPPFGQMAALIVSAEDKALAQDYTRAMLMCAPACAGIRVLGPAEATILRIRGRYRFRFFVRADIGAPLQAFVRQWVASLPKAHRDIKVSVDIDPYNFL